MNVLDERCFSFLVIQHFRGNPCAGKWRTQFMADGQQQLPLGIQHLLDIVGHRVETARQFAKLILTFDIDPMAYGANIRTNCMILLSNNIADNLFVQ